MNCGVKTKSAILTFERSALLYDISNSAFVEADIMEDRDTHAQHQTFDITQDGNIDRVDRMLDLAHSECIEMMYPFSKTICSDEEVRDNSLREPQGYLIELTIPSDFAQSTITLISKLVHEYMVCRVLVDWLGVTKPQAARHWQDKLEDITKKIKSGLYNRHGRTRRTLSPF